MGRNCPQLNKTWCPVGTNDCDNLMQSKMVCVLVRNAGNGAAGPIATAAMTLNPSRAGQIHRAVQNWIDNAYHIPLDLQNLPFDFDLPTQTLGGDQF